MAGGYEHSFIDAPDDLKCPVCLYVCKDPHQVECCGKVFCNTCITRVKDRSNVCPNCREKSFNMFKDGRSRRDIKRLKVSCPNEGKGCGWSGELEDYDDHQHECGFEEVKCPNGECDASIQARLLDDHLKDECPGRLVECQICHDQIAHLHMDSHPSICPKVEVECPNSGCSVKFCRDQLTEHRNVCPKQKIDCPYKMSGCDTTILREDREKHLMEYMYQHSVIADDTISTLRTELNTAKGAIQSQRVPPVTFKMNNYKHRKQNSETWRSAYFYSHPNGYKMRLKINVCSERYPNDVSAYVELAENHPNDDVLVWPFKGSITLQILNQKRDGGHHTKTINMGGGGGARDTLDNGDNWYYGWGYPEFISHSILESTSSGSNSVYMKDDCVYFRISEVSVDLQCKPWLTCSPVVESPSEY